MDSLRKPRFLSLLLVLAAIVAASAAFGNWLPLLATLPWLAAIAWFGSRDTGAAREFPSAAETARERLWVR
jgi:4-hydroxybenzoate polyprenyltransferase